MPDISYEFLTRFFRDHLPFVPTPSQVADFQADLCLVSPFLMEASLIEVREGTKGYLLVYRPGEWRAAIFEVYNRKVAEHAQLFPVFHTFETAFRSTVAVALEAHYAHARWWRGFYDAIRKGDSPKSVVQIGGTGVSRRVAYRIGRIISEIDGEDLSRGIVGPLQNGYEFLQACHLSHIRQLIEEHWGVFSGRLNMSLADFTAKFERVRLARNDVYHHKSVSGTSAVVAAAEELLDRLNFSLCFVHQKISNCRPAPPTFSIAIVPRHRTW